LKRKLIKAHSLLDKKLSESAWKIAEDALKAGDLEHLGLPRREQSVGLPLSEGETLQRAAVSLVHSRYFLANGMTSQNDAGIFDFLDIGVENLRNAKSPIEKYTIISEFERFPNLRALFGEIENPFQRIARFRQSRNAKKFREWLSTASDPGSKAQLIREYVDACSNRRNLFDSAPAKFVKLVSMIAISHLVGVEASAAVGAVLTVFQPRW
jgi:hypothetical protein